MTGRSRTRRHCTALGALAMMGLAPHATLAAPETITAPLACAMEQSRLVVTPGPERAHPLIGPRSSHAFTACAPGRTQRCQTWIVHKFNLACDGTQVSWVGFAGAALEKDNPRVRIVGGRFTLRMPPGWSGVRGDTDPGRNDSDTVAFPVGFAPILSLPVRFTGGSEPPATVTTLEPPAAAPSAIRVAAGRPDAPIQHDAPKQLPTSELLSWTMTIEPVVTALGTSRDRLGSVAAAVVLAWGVLFFVRRRVGGRAKEEAATAAPLLLTVAEANARDAPSADDAGDQWAASAEEASAKARAAAGDADLYAAHCAKMISEAVSSHRAARETLPSIAHPSLRGVLQEDLERAQAVLLAPRLARDIAAGAWASVELAVAAVLADLDRIGRIIDGVAGAAKPAVLRHATTMPATAHEAFDLLGVTPDASPVAVKKIVDGLRLSWHPDHAKSDSDRHAREARMRQINVAWDLIQERQQAA